MKEVSGRPDPKHVSTSFVERQNWTVRGTMRRYTRLSNGFSRKMENHAAATALNYFAYNFIKIHRMAAVMRFCVVSGWSSGSVRFAITSPGDRTKDWRLSNPLQLRVRFGLYVSLLTSPFAWAVMPAQLLLGHTTATPPWSTS